MINEFWWHNSIAGTGSVVEIVNDAKYCLRVAEFLKGAVDSGAAQITNADNSPSLTMWKIVDADKYDVICKTHGFEVGNFQTEEAE